MIKVLFITHEVSRTGAPLVLYNIVKWIRESVSEISTEVLSLRDGPFSHDFSLLGTPYYVLPERNPQRGLRRHFMRDVRGGFIKKLQKVPFDIIYANSVVSLEAAFAIKRTKRGKVICHVHELPTVIKMVKVDPTLFKGVDRFIAASVSVKDGLVEEYGVDPLKIAVVYENIDLNATFQKSKVGHASVDKRLDGKQIVMAAGIVHWRKGYEYFMEVARQVMERSERDNVLFVWVGLLTKEQRIIIDADLRKMGLTERVLFLGEQPNPYPYFQQSSIFLLPSKEDPFPLVCLEAGLLGVPIICFDKAGGIPELLERGGGVIVPYGNCTAMADATIALLEDNERRKEMGEKLALKVREYDVRVLAPQIAEIIKAL